MVKIWDLETRKEKTRFAHEGVCTVAARGSASPFEVFSGGYNKSVLCWDLRCSAEGGRPVQALPHRDWVMRVESYGDSPYIRAADKAVRLWDTRRCSSGLGLSSSSSAAAARGGGLFATGGGGGGRDAAGGAEPVESRHEHRKLITQFHTSSNCPEAGGNGGRAAGTGRASASRLTPAPRLVSCSLDGVLVGC